MRRSWRASGSPRPLLGALQAILLLIVWIHGCLGFHFWLRLKPFYPRVKEPLLAAAVLLPTLALLGYYQGGERTLVAIQDPAMAGAQPVARPRSGPRPRARSLVEGPHAPLVASGGGARSDAARERFPTVAGEPRRLDPTDLS